MDSIVLEHIEKICEVLGVGESFLEDGCGEVEQFLKHILRVVVNENGIFLLLLKLGHFEILLVFDFRKDFGLFL